MPDISFSNDGLDFYIPIFLVTSESSDITFSPRRINDRGSGAEINFQVEKEDMLNTFDLIYFMVIRSIHPIMMKDGLLSLNNHL